MYVSDKELKDSITLNTPVPTNFQMTKTMDDYFTELLEDQKKKEIALTILSKSYRQKYLK